MGILGKQIRRLDRKQYDIGADNKVTWKIHKHTTTTKHRQSTLFSAPLHPAHRRRQNTMGDSTIEKDFHQGKLGTPILYDKTAEAVRVEVVDLLHDLKGVCNQLQMASALRGSRKVRQYLDQPGSGALMNQPESGGLVQNMKKAVVFLKDGIAKLMISKTNQSGDDAALKLKYAYIEAMKKLESAAGATQTKIYSWESAMQILSTVMELQFPAQNQSHQKVEKEDQMVVVPAPRRRSTIGIDTDLMTSDQKWWAIIAAPRPELLSEQPPDVLRSEIASMQERRHEKERQRKAELEAESKREEEEKKAEEARQLASQLMRAFTDEEEQIIYDAIYGYGPDDEIVASLGPDSVQRGSMQRLQPGEWLNDEAIHYFYVMLGIRDQVLCQEEEGRKRSHFFKSFFMTKLLNEGSHTQHGQYEYKNVKRWSKKVPGKDIFALDKIFFPINVAGQHWVCAVAFMQEKKIQLYDSMGSQRLEYQQHILHYIQDEHQDKKKTPLPDVDQWQLVPCTADTPQQANGFDCGVFTCMFADFLSRNCPLLFTQHHVTQCRQRIALSIMSGQAIV